MAGSSKKPIPTPVGESVHFWEGIKKREFRLMKCQDCGCVYFYPRPLCPKCMSSDTTWIVSTGKGTLYSFAINHIPVSDAFAQDVPYITCLVELDEGPRVMSNLVGVRPDPAEVKIGMPVEVVYEDVTEEIALYKFRPRKPSS